MCTRLHLGLYGRERDGVGTRALLKAEVWLEMDYYVYRCVHTAKEGSHGTREGRHP